MIQSRKGTCAPVAPSQTAGGQYPRHGPRSGVPGITLMIVVALSYVIVTSQSVRKLPQKRFSHSH